MRNELAALELPRRVRTSLIRRSASPQSAQLRSGADARRAPLTAASLDRQVAPL
jgi:hypothetical protein